MYSTFWSHVFHDWCQTEAAEKYMNPAAHGVCAIFVVHQQLPLLLRRQQKPKLKMFFYFSTSFFAIQFINMENGFGNWSVKCALLIRRIGRTAHTLLPAPWLPMGSDLGHFIMPFTCAHTCAKCVLHKLHITHTPRSRRLRKFIQAKSKFRWQINYAQNSWPLCMKEEEEEEAEECQLTASMLLTAKNKGTDCWQLNCQHCRWQAIQH